MHKEPTCTTDRHLKIYIIKIIKQLIILIFTYTHTRIPHQTTFPITQYRKKRTNIHYVCYNFLLDCNTLWLYIDISSMAPSFAAPSFSISLFPHGILKFSIQKFTNNIHVPYMFAVKNYWPKNSHSTSPPLCSSVENARLMVCL